MSKKSKTRDCPAVGHPIKSIECGENRHRSYQCPSDCPHSPFSFGNYNLFNEIENRTDNATLVRANEDRYSKPIINQAANKRQNASPHAWFSTLINLFFNTKGDDGLLFGERWKQDGYPGLRGDEKLLFNCKRQSRFILLEIQIIHDSETLTCIDLLNDPHKQLTFIDKSLASRACRFQRFACIAFPSPNFWRINGPLIPLPSAQHLSTTEALAEIARHLGGTLDQSWLLANLASIADAATETRKEQDRLYLLNSDLVDAVADYQLTKPISKLLPKFEKAGFEYDELTKAEAKQGWRTAYILPIDNKTALKFEASMAGATPYLGTLLVQAGKAQLHATSQKNLTELRRRFEKALGSSAKFSSELVSNRAAQEAKHYAPANPSLIPPAFLNETGSFTQTSSRMDAPVDEDTIDQTAEGLISAYYRKLIDQAIPQLENKTPSEAAVDFLLRPKLIEWAKGLATTVDSQNLHSGTEIDINWLFKKLGLDEIDFPPPPSRLIPPSSLDPEDDLGDEDFDEEDEEAMELNDLELLIEERLNEYETAAEAMDDMAASGCDLIDELFAATDQIITEDQYNVVIPLLIAAWLAIVPPGKQLPLPQDLAINCARNFLAATAELASNPSISDEESITRTCHDPLLLYCLLRRLEITNKSLPKKLKFNPQGMSAAFATLVIGINVLIEALGPLDPFDR